MRTSSRPARARSLYHSAVMVGRWEPGCLPTMTQGFDGHAADACQHRLRRGCQGHHARACLAVAEPKLACGAVHIVPAEREDLVQPAAGEHEEAERGDGVGRDRALSPGLGLRLRQRLAQAPVLLAGEEALALSLFVFAHGTAGVGAVRHEAPGGGQREHLGEDRQCPVGGTRRLAQPIVERRDVGTLDHG